MKLTPVSNDLKKYTKSDPDLSFVKKKTILISNSFRLLKSPIHFQRLLSVENRPRFHWPDRYITEKANNSFELLKPIKQR